MDEVALFKIMQTASQYNKMVEKTFPEVKVFTVIVPKNKWSPDLEKKMQAWVKEQCDGQ